MKRSEHTPAVHDALLIAGAIALIAAAASAAPPAPAPAPGSPAIAPAKPAPGAGRPDLADVLASWGPCPAPCSADLNADGVVNEKDLDIVIAGGIGVVAPPDPGNMYFCDTEPLDVPIGGAGGMTGDGWDGAGAGAATIFWNVEGTSADLGAGQRAALVNAMQAWADVVQITWVEMPLANLTQSVDWLWTTGNHCAVEPAECADADCPFGGGTLAHAGFPPGVNSACVNPMAETWAGNVHFNEAFTWEQQSEGAAGSFSLTLIACHEVGHSIGLTHAGGADVMRPFFDDADTFVGLSANDIANVRDGYATGTGDVVTLEESGIWVDLDAGGFWPELGTATFPFNTVIEGVSGVPPFTTNVTVHIEAGSYDETMTITQAMKLVAENGVVTIGQ